ncbi:MAG: site-specific integrase, partial [Deltaproteobacteria bacterium]|nr:site-specific integrase [Deltaproteobacteria bacterium]
MATITQRKSQEGKTSYQVKVRLKGHLPATATFDRLTDAKRWAQKTEVKIREGRYFQVSESKKKTVADLIRRYRAEILPQKKTTKT